MRIFLVIAASCAVPFSANAADQSANEAPIWQTGIYGGLYVGIAL